MMALTPRAVVVLVASAGVELGLAHAAHSALAAALADLPVGPAGLDQRVAGALTLLAVGAALIAWTGWCLTLVRAARRPVLGPTGSRWLRAAAVVLGLSAVTLAGATPVLADRTDPPRSATRLDLDGLQLPDLPVSSQPRPRPDRARPDRLDPPGHVVVAGDSLWTIAAAHLPAGASNAAVDRAWRRWYAANRAVIGPDPDLIVPGQVLFPPPVRRTVP